MSKPIFKKYPQHQMVLLPPSLEELIEKNHPVRVVNDVLERINIDALLKKYKGGGTTSFHPRMLLKVVVYAYMSNVYSSRKMEAALKENIHFMWLSGMQQPDHNTINRFRSERLKEVVKKIFAEVVASLIESGHVSLKEVYTDGTKIEANANRYTFVWGNAIKTSKLKMEAALKQLWQYGESVAAEELKDQTPTTFAPISAEHVKHTIEKIDEALKDKPITKKAKQKLNYAKKNFADRVTKYQAQEKILQSRNSYSKTDHHATFMRMKEDHMRNGQLKPGYNVQLSTCDQYILCYSLHQNPTDTLTLSSHLNQFENLHNTLPQTLTADAGYGSEENYSLLEEKNIEPFVKYNYFDREQHTPDENPFHAENLFYNSQQDAFYCPMGQRMNRIGNEQRKTKSGFVQTYARYQAQRCEGCPLRGSCHQSKNNRTIEINYSLKRHKQKAKQNLLSEQGIRHRKKRCHDTEPVFANIKHNKGFKRFMLRGLPKVEIETALIAIAHNLQKRVA
jgi:transposase